MAACRSYLNLEIAKDLKMAQILMRDSCFDMSGRDLSGMNSLHWAVWHGDYNKVRILLANKEMANITCNYLYAKCSPLHLAAYRDFVDIIELLLAHGAVIDARNWPCGVTPLHEAARRGHLRAVNALIRRGADVNLCDHSNKTVLNHAASFYRIIQCLLNNRCHIKMLTSAKLKETPLYRAAMNGSQHAMNYVLTPCKIRDERPILRTMLQRLPRVRMVQLLVNTRPEIRIRPDDETSLLHLAVYRAPVQVIDFLVLDAFLDVDMTSSDGCTPLQLACTYQNIDAISRLLDFECDINIGVEQIISTISYQPMDSMRVGLGELLMEHCERLSALNLPWSSLYNNLFDRDRYDPPRLTVRKMCVAEVELMKRTNIDGLRTTLYDLLVSETHRSAMCLRGVSYSPTIFTDLFEHVPMFHGMVHCRILKAFKRLSLIQTFKQECHEPPLLASLPDLCLDYVLKYLCDKDLANLIEAVSR